jgi:2-desacetyl-2-hydroxyethyl bacteriochlorophyllide A dehydrogenase
MKRTSLYFTATRQISLEQESLPTLNADQVLVKTHLSAVSSGTEMLLYRGLFPLDLPVDETLPALSGAFRYPLKYGYSLVGQVVERGSEIDPAWEGRSVFAFQPHESHFIADPSELIPLPEGLSLEEALFVPNMETAVTLLMDGRPLVGEQVAVFGQGIVGLLTTALLARFPLASLVTLDRYPLRRQASLDFGAHASLNPELPEVREGVRAHLTRSSGYHGADLTYELSGKPAALDQAIALTGFHGRVVIGSWYGTQRADLDLGGTFHRARIRLISSQVSTLPPHLSGRWDKARRFDLVWELIRKVKPSQLITQRFPIQEAADAYALLDQNPEEAIQIVFQY